IYKIRKALNDEDGVRYIATIPRRGYRFVADVEDVDGTLSPPGDTGVSVASVRSASKWAWLAAALLAAAAASLMMWRLRTPGGRGGGRVVFDSPPPASRGGSG